ncbi:hypothetical protein QOZ80_2AG0106320 [Eleusine coracana subsp. coracana]|nr:hypothetical protein QOZ80_2AG0106320 [Eleusine coracana subsp. coracana]
MTTSSSNGATPGDEHKSQKLSPSGLPIRAIPGGYGVPFLSPLRDRLDYYYLQGPEAFFRTRIARHGGATVLRVNMPPGPFLARDPRVVALLDARSFRVLLDDAKVDKSGTLDGTFVPSPSLFGGRFPLAFLDAADPRHAQLKRVMISLAVSRMHAVAPAFRAAFGTMFDAVDDSFAVSGKVEFNAHNAVHMLDFTCAALFGGAPPSKAIGADASRKAVKWLAWQLHPLASGVVKPWPLEHLLLHTVRLPPFLVARDYGDLTAYFAAVAAAFLDDHAKKQQSGGPNPVSREELLHNLVFLAIFNAYGGFKIMLPHLVKWLARAGPGLHARLAAEARNGGEDDDVVTLAAIDRNMPLVKSVVWEALRLNPPVEFQYGRAWEDLPFATRDDRVFRRAGEFVPDRFVVAGEDERRRMLEHVVWSNGAETAEAKEGNKQCPGKDMVVAVARLMVAELFRRYDTFDATVVEMPLEPVVTFMSMTKATTKKP